MFSSQTYSPIFNIMTMQIFVQSFIFYRLRQSVAVKELLNAKGKLNLSNGGGSNGVNDKQKSLFMRKTVSVPNMSHVSVLISFTH